MIVRLRRLRLRQLTLRQKLVAITMTTVAGVVVLLSGAVALNETVGQRRSLYQKRTEQLDAVARIVASRSTAALVFDDAATAAENLRSLHALRADAAPVSAAIYLPGGEPFAEYRSTEQGHQRRAPLLARGCPGGALARGELLQVCAPVALDQDRLGEVRIVYDMSEDLRQFRRRLLVFLATVVAAALVSLGLALLLSWRLQRIISEPILALREATRSVAADKDYSLRVTRPDDDELGVLVDGFNDMLAQIQHRDDALARYNARLEAEVRARTLELEQANRRRLLWLENLARILRHELKNATVGMSSSLDLIERRAADPRVSRYVGRARSSVAFMSKLLDSVGTASTLESSFEQDRKQLLDLARLVARQAELYRQLYPDARLVCRCESALLVYASDTRMMQLLDKLVANAVDYHLPGTEILVAAEACAGEARLSVSNRGEALPEDRSQLFELFVSLRRGAHKHGENFGLGLYIVKLIAEAHDGRVSAENLADGVRFSVMLPLAAEAQSASQR